MEQLTKDQKDRMLLYATYAILYLNDTACFSIQQLGIHAKGKDNESIKIYGALNKRCKLYIRMLSEIVNNSMDYYCDFCTEMDSISDESYSKFKDALKKAYKDAGLDDYEYLSSVEIMRSMVEVSVEAGKKIIKDISKYLPQVKWLEKYLLVDIRRVANNFSDWSYRHVGKDVKIDFNEDTDVMKSFRELNEKLISFNSFDAAYRKAVELELERKKTNNQSI